MSKRRGVAAHRRRAELYERYVARHILGPWAPLLVDAARLAPGERVLDVACGTGVVARVAAERVGPTGHVVGIDLNAGMIRVARSLPPPQGAPIEWFERSALDLGLATEASTRCCASRGCSSFPTRRGRCARCAACSAAAAGWR